MIKRTVPFFTIGLLFILSVACAPGPGQISLRVAQVIDGDTIKLSNGERVRYIGIDTPEMRIKQGQEFVYSPQPFAQEALQFNRDLVQGKAVRLEFDVERRDRYGRLLAYCFVDDTHINAKLIEAGYATLYTIPPNVKYVDEFVQLQREARRSRQGMWGAYGIVEASRAHAYIDQIRRVRGRVLNTYNSGKAVFLNFGQDYKQDFTVVIFKKSFDYFSDQGVDPATFYRGKTIEVSGKVRQYNGPEIIVGTPQEIEVIE